MFLIQLKNKKMNLIHKPRRSLFLSNRYRYFDSISHKAINLTGFHSHHIFQPGNPKIYKEIVNRKQPDIWFCLITPLILWKVVYNFISLYGANSKYILKRSFRFISVSKSDIQHTKIKASVLSQTKELKRHR